MLMGERRATAAMIPQSLKIFSGPYLNSSYIMAITMNLLEQISVQCEKRPYAVILAIILITAALGTGISRISMATDQAAFLPEGKESIIASQLVFEEFGGQALETILIEGDVATLEGIYALDSLKKSILDDPQLEGYALSVTYYYDMYASEGMLPSQINPQSYATLQQILSADALLESPRVIGRAITEDYRYALMSVRVASDLSEAEAVEPTRRLEELVQSFSDEEEELAAWVTGDYSIMLDNMETISKDNAVLMPLAAAFIVVVLLLVFRKVTDVIFPFATIAVALIWIMGAMGYLGIPFTSILVALAPLLLGITIDYAIHILFRYNEERRSGESVETATRQCLRHTGTAVFLSAGTTVFGFLSFGISELPPMRDFGLLAVLGIICSFVLVVTLLPALVVLRDRRSQHVMNKRSAGTMEALSERMMRSLVSISLHRRTAVFAIAAIITAGSLAVMPQVETTINWEDMNPSDTESFVILEQIADVFGSSSGGGNLLVVVEGDLLTPSVLQEVVALEADLRGIAGTNAEGAPFISSPFAVQSYADMIVQANNGKIPTSSQQIETILQLALSSPETYQLFASSIVMDPTSPYYQGLGLISIQAAAMSEQDIDVVVTQVRNIVSEHEGGAASYRVTGGFAIVSDIFGGISSTQLRTTLLALILCFIVVTLLLRSPFYGALSLLPVALTISWEFLILWALGWSFDLFTVMISALIVGLGIDFAVHIIHRFDEEVSQGKDTEEAIGAVVVNVGKALSSTTVTTAGAFAIIGLSIMPIMARFGILTAVTIVFSFLIALFVLPPILAWNHARTIKA